MVKLQVFVERTRKSFAAFAKTTQMHGFREIYHAKTLIGTISWMIIVFAAIVLTVYQVYRCIIQFTSRTTLSIISPLESGGIMYPPLSLCFIHWISWLDWKKAYAMNFTKPSVLYGLTFLSPIFSYQVFNVTEAKAAFLENMALHNITTVSEFYKLVAKPLPMVLGLYDKAHAVEQPPFFTDIEFHLKGSDLYLCYQVDGDDIIKILQDRKDTSKMAARTKIQIFNFSLQDFRFSRVSSYITEEAYNFYVSYWLLTKTNYWLDSLSDFKRNFTAFAFPYRIYPDTYSDKYIEISTEYDSYFIEMKPSVHRWMNTKDYKCKERKKAVSSDKRCLDTCKANFRNNFFLCLALDQAILLQLDIPSKLCQNEIYFLTDLYSNDNSNKSISDLFSLEDVFNNDNLSSEDISNDTYIELEREYDACVENCFPMCEIWKYEFTSSFQILASSVRAYSYTNQTDINIIYPNEIDVLIVIEENAQTWEDFVGNVGGLLGVWTGASILSFLQLIYLCCCSDCSCDRVNRVIQLVRAKDFGTDSSCPPTTPTNTVPHITVQMMNDEHTAITISPSPLPPPGMVMNDAEIRNSLI